MGVLTNSAKLIEKIQSIKSVVTGSTAPSNPSTGDLWYDTTSTVNALKMYDGTNWIVMGPELVSLTQAQYDALPAAEKNNGKYYLITDGNGVVVAGGITTTQPSNPTTGDTYYDTINNVLKIYNGTSWSIVGDDSADVNTKTFYISSTSDLTTAQAAYDWYVAGKNPIVVYGDAAYVLYSVLSGQIVFRSTIMGVFDDDNLGYSFHTIRKLSFTISSDTVTNIVVDYNNVSGSFLRTGKNYSTPYTPQYDGSPATKKYVDDLVGDVETLLAAI